MPAAALCGVHDPGWPLRQQLRLYCLPAEGFLARDAAAALLLPDKRRLTRYALASSGIGPSWTVQ